MKPRAVALLTLIFLAVPYLLLLRLMPSWHWPEWDEFAWALKNSLLQATGSAALAVTAGALLLPGFLRLPPSLKAFGTWALLAPSFFPPIFLLLSFLSLLNPFPMGLPGIVLIQGFMNAGLLTVLFARILEEKWIGLMEVAQVSGASPGLFLRAAGRGILPDVALLGVFVFTMSFASFSIPFVIGAGKATTLEILIYEKIRIAGDWGSALALSFLQLAIIGTFMFLPGPRQGLHEGRPRDLRFWGQAWGLLPLAAYALVFWTPLLKGVFGSWRAIEAIPGLWNEIGEQTAVSMSIAAGTGVVCLVLLVATSFAGPDNGVPRLLRGWLAPSTALLGFAFLFHGGEGSLATYVLALCLIFFPAVYRLGMDRTLGALREQAFVARSLGASEILIWLRILVPQIWSTACWLAGVVSVWALGEFALGKVILGRPVTWSLLTESLMSSYRIEAGLGLSTLILVGGFALFLTFWGLGHVRR